MDQGRRLGSGPSASNLSKMSLKACSSYSTCFLKMLPGFRVHVELLLPFAVLLLLPSALSTTRLSELQLRLLHEGDKLRLL